MIRTVTGWDFSWRPNSPLTAPPSHATSILPFALAFAAGAMVFVVLDDSVPEYMEGGNQKLGSAGAIFGFIVMMSLDVGLG